jgi:S-adenosylmethionine decarboxylase
MEKIVLPGGNHLILECVGGDVEILKDVKRIQIILEESARRAGAYVLHSYMHHFGGDYGVTGLICLSESHISIHTWPENNYSAIDIFMCGNCDPQISADYIINQFGCTAKITALKRKIPLSA